MLNQATKRLLIGLGSSMLAACAPGSGPGAQPPEGGSVSPTPPTPFEAELRASPPSQPSAGAPSAGTPSAGTPPAAPAQPAAVSGSVATPGPAPTPTPNAPATGAAPVANASLECVVPPDPELDQESSWSRELGQRLQGELEKLRHCTAALPAGDEQSLTLRLVYQKDGSPVSQHVVTSSPEACLASECLKRGLAGVRSPTLVIDKASIDLNLALARGRAPLRRSEPVDPLTPEPMPESAGGCVDPEVARLSRETVREIVSTAYDGLQKCYAQGLGRDHSLTGTVTFEFVIGQDGAVAEAWAREATLPDCEAIRCMLAQFRALRFPEPVGRSVRVLYPINYVLEQSPVLLR